MEGGVSENNVTPACNSFSLPKTLGECSLVVGSLLILGVKAMGGESEGDRQEVGLQWAKP